MKFHPFPRIDTHHIQRYLHWQRRPAPKRPQVERPLMYVSRNNRIRTPPDFHWLYPCKDRSLKRRMWKLSNRLVRA